MSATSIRRQNGQGAVRMAEATCPTCASPIPREKLDAIIGKLRAHDAEIEHAAEARFALREAAIRKQATAAATAALRERISQAEQAKKAAEEQGKNLKAKQDAMLKARIEAERKAAAKKLEDAINAEKAKAYQEKLKLTGQLGDLRRRLERRDRPAGVLGDEGELDAFTILTERFAPEGDEITRTKKFTRGGDIEHRIAHGSGLILYEVKNHQNYDSKWTERAKENQRITQSDHVVIVSTAFPAKHSELMLSDDGVLVVAPARLQAVATWLRMHTIRSHSLKLSNENRQNKSARLYEFMCSDNVADRWDRVAQTITRMRDALRSERVGHERSWNERVDQISIIEGIRDSFVQDLDAIFEATEANAVN